MSQLDVAWSFPAGDVNYSFSPLVIDNIAYVAAKRRLAGGAGRTTGKETLGRITFPTADGVSLGEDRRAARR